MGFRFQRRVKIAKGVHLNLSKSGIGVSAGIPGARIGIGPRGVRKTIGIPGTGLSYTSTSHLGPRVHPSNRRQARSAGTADSDRLTLSPAEQAQVAAQLQRMRGKSP